MYFPQIAASATVISIEEMADLMEESECLRSLDQGNLIVHFIAHPQRGNLMLANNSYGECILTQLA